MSVKEIPRALVITCDICKKECEGKLVCNDPAKTARLRDKKITLHRPEEWTDASVTLDVCDSCMQRVEDFLWKEK